MQWSQPLLFNIYCIDCNHCNMNLTVSLLPPRIPPCAAAVCCRALTTFHGPHYFQHCSRVPLSSHRRKILVQATSVNKRAMCIGCLCTSGWIIYALACVGTGFRVLWTLWRTPRLCYSCQAQQGGGYLQLNVGSLHRPHRKSHLAEYFIKTLKD